MRSTSHFWAKLYELSTPAHLLVAAGITPSSSSVPAGANNVEGDRSNSNDRDAADSFSNPASPISSPFSSRVATPMGSPMPAGPSTTTAAGVASSSNSGGGVAMRKMISRHSSRSLVMSKSQLERGKLLELCLSVLGCSAQWHLHLLANRYWTL